VRLRVSTEVSCRGATVLRESVARMRRVQTFAVPVGGLPQRKVNPDQR
jgi:hypothetical protein